MGAVRRSIFIFITYCGNDIMNASVIRIVGKNTEEFIMVCEFEKDIGQVNN